MITTFEEIKKHLGYTTTVNDDRIKAMLADGFELQILDWLNNYFIDSRIQYGSGNMVFSADDKTITDTGAQFVTDHFAKGTYYISGSYENDGFIEVLEVAETQLSLATKPVDEDHDEWIDIYRVRFPNALKGLIARAIGERLNKSAGVTSETVGSVARSFADGFSSELREEFAQYRRPFK